MNCPNCGLIANENDKFCIGCGTRLRKPEPPAEAIPPAPAEIEKALSSETTLDESFTAIKSEADKIINEAEAKVEEAAETVAAPIEKAAEEPVFVPVVTEPVEPVQPAAPVQPEPVFVPVITEPVEPVQPAAPIQPEPVIVPAAPTIPVESAPAAPVEPEEEYDNIGAVMTRLNKPLSVWGYVWRILLFALPIINIIPLFIMAFSSGINKNSKHFASAVLILMLIGLILLVGGVVYLLLTNDATTVNNFINSIFVK